ncbi:Ankyrin repeat-containing domain [Phytophthora cactorum]|nr:Ankyrin repeat-containing domain [Phytophthora cactorum]
MAIFRFVKLFLEKGVSIDLADNKGWTPLVSAAQEGHTDVAAILLKAGAVIDIQRRSGATAHSIATEKGHLSVVGLFLEGWTPLRNAFQQSYPDVLAHF